MKSYALAALLPLAILAAAPPTAPPKSPKPARKAAARRRAPVAAPISAAARAAARTEIETKMAAVPAGFENPEALAGFYAALKGTAPVHVLQFGDSHTASDDWVNAMRTAAQAKYGDGGPGFVQAGRPYRGYRRFDATGRNSPGWVTEGTLAARGDATEGLSGISISTRLPGQTVGLTASGDSLQVFFLRQPGGGRLELTIDGEAAPEPISTDGEPGPGRYESPLPPGQHELSLRTLDHAPVRVFGWSLDKPAGVTFETLGINGAQASLVLEWNESVWAAEVAERKPALIVIAYGTNEANSPRFEPDQYRADLNAVIERLRRAAPNASLLMIGPPDCGRLRPLRYLDEVVDIQRGIAKEQQVAFWDWRLHMGGPGIVKRWVLAGLSQADHIHLTTDGYRLLGKLIFDQLELSHE